MFPDGSGDLLSENFEPAWFLLEHHHGTSFDDLRVGLSYLKRKVDSQNEGQLSFLKVSNIIIQTYFIKYYVSIYNILGQCWISHGTVGYTFIIKTKL